MAVRVQKGRNATHTRNNTIELMCDGANGSEKTYVPLIGINSGTTMARRIRVDAHLGSVPVFSTNVDDEVATHPSPALQATLSWKSEGSASPGSPLILPDAAFSALRLDFSALSHVVITAM